jgi:hypothetical protein
VRGAAARSRRRRRAHRKEVLTLEIHFLSGWSIPVIRQVLTWALRILLPCVLLLGLLAGINWLIQQPWSPSGAETFSCDSGQHLVWHYIGHGQKTLLWCA